MAVLDWREGSLGSSEIVLWKSESFLAWDDSNTFFFLLSFLRKTIIVILYNRQKKTKKKIKDEIQYFISITQNSNIIAFKP